MEGADTGRSEGGGAGPLCDILPLFFWCYVRPGALAILKIVSTPSHTVTSSHPG